MRHKVLIPKGPTADQLLPYLRKIDASHWYSNSGPLVQELESRMGGVSVSSATLGLEIVAPLVFKARRVRIPAFTFVATVTALLKAGMEPVLCDVDEFWALVDPDEQSLSVCPFGASVAPVGLIDAAAGWGNQHQGNRVYSLHATKSLSSGEGGMICGDDELFDRVRRLANFGILSKGIVTEAGTNAKMSEYHAAVGLASLDAWEANRDARDRLAEVYYARLDPEIATLPNAGVMTAFPILVDNAEKVALDMASKGIETRRWYCPTLDRHPAFASLPKEGGLTNAHRLGDSILCLPFHLFLTPSDVDEICEVLEWAIKRNTTSRIFSRTITRVEPPLTGNQVRI